MLQECLLIELTEARYRKQKHMGGDSTLTWCNTMSMNKTNKTWRVHYALQICRATWEETGSCYEMASPKKCLETSWTEKSNRNMMEKNRKRIKRLQPRSANQKHQGCWVQFNCAQGATVWWPRPGTIVPRWWKKLGLCAAPSVMEHCQTVWFFPLALTVDLLSKTIIIHSMNINHIIYMKYHDTVPKKHKKLCSWIRWIPLQLAPGKSYWNNMWNASMMSTQCTTKNLNNL